MVLSSTFSDAYAQMMSAVSVSSVHIG